MPELDYLDSSIIKQIFPPRKSGAHKNDHGHLLVIGGSKLYSGSPAFNALAAYKVGVDMVTIAAPRRAADIAASFSPDLITYPLEGDWLNLSHLNEIDELIQGKTAVLIGGGIGRRDETQNLVREILKTEHLPIVLDADAIYAVVGHHHLLKEKKFVLTPHIYEFQILTEETPPHDFNALTELVKKWAIELTSTIILKGQNDIISDGQQTVINETGNPFMTVGGTGDTLAGIFASLLARGVEEFAAASGAAYINGAAGDLAAAQLGPGFMASDLLNCIPQVIMDIIAP
ncbi:NAD(P)H-hydrate dehydratase [Patescibacteria group bacterium]|nr:NAD(P)H-hydrate dehydratase [Patescibacteria group bacterium]